MEVDDTPSQSLSHAFIVDEENQVQKMEEESESIDLNGLDILAMEKFCRKRDYDKISELQIRKLEVIIAREYQQQQLGIQPGSQWDIGLPPKDSKKRGRRTDLQRTIVQGKILVELGRYAKLTNY